MNREQIFEKVSSISYILSSISDIHLTYSQYFCIRKQGRKSFRQKIENAKKRLKTGKKSKYYDINLTKPRTKGAPLFAVIDLISAVLMAFGSAGAKNKEGA